VARKHAKIWAQLTAAGHMIGLKDLLVAATALQRNWAVATLNAREFWHVRDLEVLTRQGLRPARHRTVPEVLGRRGAPCRSEALSC
jgi:hypothetical protein